MYIGNKTVQTMWTIYSQLSQFLVTEGVQLLLISLWWSWPKALRETFIYLPEWKLATPVQPEIKMQKPKSLWLAEHLPLSASSSPPPPCSFGVLCWSSLRMPCCATAVHAVRVSNLHKGPAAHKHWEHFNILGGWWSVLWEFKDSREQS